MRRVKLKQRLNTNSTLNAVGSRQGISRGKIAYLTRLRNGSEARRLVAVRKAHKEGRYQKAHEAARIHVMQRAPEVTRAIAQRSAITSRALGYPWLRGKNNPMNRMTAEQRRQFDTQWRSKMLCYWQNPEWVRAHLEKAGRPPNRFESRLITFLSEHALPFKFVGDWSFWLRTRSGKNKNPDFIHVLRGVRLAILAHGRYWHQNIEAVEQEQQDYAGIGWGTLIIWDDEALNLELVDRIRAFVGAASSVSCPQELAVATI